MVIEWILMAAIVLGASLVLATLYEMIYRLFKNRRTPEQERVGKLKESVFRMQGKSKDYISKLEVCNSVISRHRLGQSEPDFDGNIAREMKASFLDLMPELLNVLTSVMVFLNSSDNAMYRPLVDEFYKVRDKVDTACQCVDVLCERLYLLTNEEELKPDDYDSVDLLGR